VIGWRRVAYDKACFATPSKYSKLSVSIDWENIVERLAKAFIWSAVAAIVMYELASRIFVWWILRSGTQPDGQLGLGAWLFGLGAGAVAALVAFCVSLLHSRTRRTEAE
jgi:hypothetical protein